MLHLTLALMEKSNICWNKNSFVENCTVKVHENLTKVYKLNMLSINVKKIIGLRVGFSEIYTIFINSVIKLTYFCWPHFSVRTDNDLTFHY